MTKMYIDLDVDLDTLHGETAMKVRLDRFADWYGNGSGIPGGKSRYGNTVERIIKTWYPRLDWMDIINYLRRRYNAFRAYNPLGFVEQYGIPCSWIERLPWYMTNYWGAQYKSMKDVMEAGFVFELLEREAWYNYDECNNHGKWVLRTGLKTLDRGNHIDGAQMGVDYDDEYHQAFEQKLQSWEDYINAMAEVD